MKLRATRAYSSLQLAVKATHVQDDRKNATVVCQLHRLSTSCCVSSQIVAAINAFLAHIGAGNRRRHRPASTTFYLRHGQPFYLRHDQPPRAEGA